MAFGGAGTSDALNGGTEQRKREQASHPHHGGAVWLLSLHGQEGSEPLVKCGVCVADIYIHDVETFRTSTTKRTA